MMYHLLAGVEQKEWLLTLDVMEKAMDHLSSCLSGADTKWWSSFIASEREKRVTWEEMEEHKYMEGQESFDISPFHFKPLSSDQDDEDEADVEDSGNVFETDWMKNIVQ